MATRFTSSGAGSAVSLSGVAAVGNTLTCLLAPGYTGTPTYQWTRDGVAIVGATTSTYVVQVGDLTHVLSCRVSGVTWASSGFTVGDALVVSTYVDPDYVAADYYA